jgi:pyruvate kinase
MSEPLTHFAKTKIVCTVGPASADPAVLAGMIRAGADVFRVNGAHADEADIARWAQRMRRARKESGYPAGLMVDLPGIKIRAGRFESPDPVALPVGGRVTFFPGQRGGTAARIPVHPWPDVSSLRKGAAVLLDDGRLVARVVSRSRDEVRAEVEHGGLLAAGKGVAFRGATLAQSVPTRRDRALARAAIAAGADWLCLSFVATPQDILRLRALAKRAGAPDLPLCAKIERAVCFEDLEAILRTADASIVARGDLGVDVGAENVPALQRQIIDTALVVGRPVIVATEMLDSMTTRERPTRAEVSDVAGAVFEGSDAVMLSGETAMGVHPVLAVETMNGILLSAEGSIHAPYAGGPRALGLASRPDRPDQHVVRAAVALAEQTGARAIVVFSRSGASVLRTSKERPHALIHGFSPQADVCRQLTLAWGVKPQRLAAIGSTDALADRVLESLRASGHLRAGERAVLVMGGARDPIGTTTMIKLLTA